MEATPIPENISPVARVYIPCGGPCRSGRRQVLPKWTAHIFIRLEPVPRAQALIYACVECGGERRYGLISNTASIDDADAD